MLEYYYIYHYKHKNGEAEGIVILDEKMKDENEPEDILCCGDWEYVRTYWLKDNFGPMHELPLGILLGGMLE